MTKKKGTKFALLVSAMSLLVCISMLVGTTFAWFTDSVSSTNNVIQSGSLDIALYWSTDAEGWEKVDESTNVFGDQDWEPGHTEVVYLKLVNEGTLALKYNLGINVVSETLGVNAEGRMFRLSNYIKFGVVETSTAFEDRGSARAAVTDEKVISAGYTKNATMNKTNDTDYLAMVVYMPESVDNNANYMAGTAAPTINLGINLVATQMAYEEDDFGPDYDLDALPCDVIVTPENINDILPTVQPGTVVGLADGAYFDFSIVIPQDNITLVSNTAIADHVNVNGKKNVKIIGITFDNYAPVAVKYEKAGKVTTVDNIKANITSGEGIVGADNLQIINCTFNGVYDTADYYPIAIYDRQRPSGASTGITVDGCTFNTKANAHIYMYYPGNGKGGDVVISNNTFAGMDGNAVAISSTRSHVSIINNTFIDCYAFVSPHNGASCTYDLKVSVMDNNFVNSGDQGLLALGLAHFHNLPDCSVIVDGNVANYGTAELSNAYIDGNNTCYATPAGKVSILSVSDAYDNDGAALKDALKQENAVVVLGAGDYGKFPAIGAGTTVIGMDGATFATHLTALDYVKLENVTFKNITFFGNAASYGSAINGTVTFEDCTFEAAGVYVHFLGGEGTDDLLVFNGCEFKGWCAFAASIENVQFNQCSFLGNGIVGTLRTYQDVTATNCTFDFSDVDTTDSNIDAITPAQGTITLINCENANGSLESIFEPTAYANGNIVIG